MSHIPHRKEKDCLNCGTIVQGKYCHNCGQENIVPKETFWHMVTHFFYDITHFDSNFFKTIRLLVLKPGFLSVEYMAGRRAQYLHPIKMYVFTSAIFFLLFFSFFKPGNNISLRLDDSLTLKDRKSFINMAKKKLQTDSGNILLIEAIKLARDTSRPFTVLDKNKALESESSVFQFVDVNYQSNKEYDSMQSLLPPSNRDGWFLRQLTLKQIEINTKFRNNPDEAAKRLGSSFLHKLPYMLFVSLPLFALLLRIVYIRRRKQFYFADHGVFTLHLYVFSFLLLLVIFTLSEIESLMQTGVLPWVASVLFLFVFFYLYKAMLTFYRQGKAKTFFKFILVSIFSILMMILLFLFFVLFSAFTL